MPHGRIQKERPSKAQDSANQDASAPLESKSKQAEEVSANLDAILDEIDSLLDQNALDMAQMYVQRGGQ